MLLCVTHHCDLGYNSVIFNESSRADLSDASFARRRIFPSHVYPSLSTTPPSQSSYNLQTNTQIQPYPYTSPTSPPPSHFPSKPPQLNYRYSLQATTLTSASIPLTVPVPLPVPSAPSVPFPPPPPNNTLLLPPQPKSQSPSQPPPPPQTSPP